MSRNSKNAQRMVAAREISATRKSGGSGPKRTTAKHGKKKAFFQLFDTHRAWLNSLKKKPGKKQKDNADVALAA